MSEQTDTIEAVARAMALAANDYEGPDLQWQGWSDIAQAATAAHTKALVDGAGEIAGKSLSPSLVFLTDSPASASILTEIGREAAATIAALRAEVERLTQREAIVREEGVRAGIEAARETLKTVPTDKAALWDVNAAIRALDAAAIAKGEG